MSHIHICLGSDCEKTIAIEIRGGCLVNVIGLPEEWSYVLVDWDQIKEDEDRTQEEVKAYSDYYNALGEGEVPMDAEVFWEGRK